MMYEAKTTRDNVAVMGRGLMMQRERTATVPRGSRQSVSALGSAVDALSGSSSFPV